MTLALLVPVHLDALHVAEPVAVVAPTLPYWHLPHVVDGRARNADVPYLAAAVERDAFHETGRHLPVGIHLHWSMPDALAHQAADGTLAPVPDRWVVRREGGGLADRTWLIESDAVRLGLTVTGPASCIPWPPEGEPPGDLPFAWLGVTSVLDETAASPPALHDGPRLAPLTVAVGGEITFAALYSRAAGVFGLHDAEIGSHVPAGLTYLVVGYHVAPGSDPLVRLRAKHPAPAAVRDPRDRKRRPPVPPTPMASLLPVALRWALEDQLPPGLGDPLEPTRAVYHAAVTFPSGTPSRRGEPLTAEVGVGNTTVEALAALLAGGDERTETALAAMRYLAERRPSGTDLEHALAEFRHDEGFHAVDGGRRWLLRPRAASAPSAVDTGATDGAAGDASGTRSPAPEVLATFERLVAAQAEYDAAWQRIGSMTERLFADWCRYLAASYPHEGARLADFPDIDEARVAITTGLLDPLRALRGATGRIVWVDDDPHSQTRPKMDPDQVGLVAMRIVELWHDLQRRLDGPSDQQGHELVLVPGPRFFSPRELSVVLRSDDALPSPRHNADGRLDDDGLLRCGTLWIPDATSAGDDVDQLVVSRAVVLDEIRRRFDAWATAPQPAIAFSFVWDEPWHPLVLEWDAVFEGLAHERQSGGHGPYPTDFLTSHFHHQAHDGHAPDLLHSVLAAGGEAPRSSPVPTTGWSLLTKGAGTVLRGAIERYLTELDLHDAQDPAVVAELRLALDRLTTETPLLSATLSGLDDALVMLRRGPQLPVHDPLALPGSVYETFATEVAALVGRPPGRAPEPAYEFHPLRTGWLQLTDVRLVDNFGRRRSLPMAQAALPSTLPTDPGDRHAFLPPRLLAPARLRADQALQGWLVVASLDERVLVYDPAGRRLGAVELDGDQAGWVPASDEPEVWAPMSDDLAAVVGWLSTDRAQFEQFGDAMAEAQTLIDPSAAAHQRGLALLMGRPIAVVRATVALELAGDPPHSQGWDDFALTLAGGPPDDAGLSALRFPLHLGAPPPDEGRLPRLDDGLLGFWADGDDVLRAPKSSTGGSRITAHAGPGTGSRTGAANVGEVELTLGKPATATLLVDPRGPTHLISGILPTERLTVDQDQVNGGLAAMEITLRAGPILTRPGHVDHLTPSTPGLAWAWVDDEMAEVQLPIEPLGDHAPLPAVLELRDGFLVAGPSPDSGRGAAR
ncbi:MAG: hypothetical protein ACKVWR_20810 [Acidimicrobiales bacterium]